MTLLPQPDSPTTHRVSPPRTAKDTPSTARTGPAGVRNSVRNSSTSSTVPAAAASAACGGPLARSGRRHPIHDVTPPETGV